MCRLLKILDTNTPLKQRVRTGMECVLPVHTVSVGKCLSQSIPHSHCELGFIIFSSINMKCGFQNIGVRWVVAFNVLTGEILLLKPMIHLHYCSVIFSSPTFHISTCHVSPCFFLSL